MTFGTTPVDDINTPLSSVYVPNTASSNLTALQGGPASTDGNGQKSAPAAMYVADGSDVTQGTSTDSAGASTVIGQLKQIRANTASVTVGGGTIAATQSGSWTVALGAGTAYVGTVAFGGTTATPVAPNSGLVVIRTGAGRLATAIVTATGTAQLNVYDNASQASGTVIGAVPALAAVGSVYQFYAPCVNGIVANAVAGCCATTICYY